MAVQIKLLVVVVVVVVVVEQHREQKSNIWPKPIYYLCSYGANQMSLKMEAWEMFRELNTIP